MAAKKEKPLGEQFKEAASRVEKLSKRPSNEQLLDLYGLFKQATEGDVTGSRPGMLDLKGRAKYDAWEKRRGASKDDAMKKYVALVGKLVADLG
jgi:acyl-CoA-binding protein